MQVQNGSDQRFDTRRPVFLTLGMFDGMHQGHLALIRHLLHWARSRAGFAAILTFDRHPRGITRGTAPPAITPISQKIYLASRLGVDGMVVLPFTRELADVPAMEFLKSTIIEGLGAKNILIGFDNRFGKGGEGSFDMLRTVAPELGLSVRQGTPVRLGGASISSTAIREAVQNGKLALAEKLLGRKFSGFGTVVSGQQKGHGRGFPTANIKPLHSLAPPPGIYATITRLGNSFHPSATFVAPDAYESSGSRLVESHLIGYEGDLYGAEIEVIFLEHIRTNKRFEHSAALTAAIADDVRRAYTAACSIRL